VAGGAAEDDAVMDFVASRLRGRLARAAADELGRAIPPSEREVLGAALEPRLAAMAAALAPWLHGGGAAGALARRRLAREAVRELERVAAGRFREVARPAAPPAERRALALVRALG
ncbi:MAG: hypothetical protein OZ921_17140, partial [Sorangiineae bacterium]|nr:hypothetical protein [Sorangiineae bacterium]